MARNRTADPTALRGGRLRIPRSRGAVSGFLLLALGIWGALIPLVGPYVHFGYTPDTTWHVTSGRVWLEILPGAATALGGLMLLLGANRITTSFGGWLAALSGAWFAVGLTVRSALHIGDVGSPIHTSRATTTVETLLLFTGLGVVILFLGAFALGRLAVVSVRDVRAAQRRAEAAAEAEAPPRHRGFARDQDDAEPADERERERERAAASESSAQDTNDTETTNRDTPSDDEVDADGRPQRESGATRLET
jgi:hypothetical protein